MRRCGCDAVCFIFVCVVESPTCVREGAESGYDSFLNHNLREGSARGSERPHAARPSGREPHQAHGTWSRVNGDGRPYRVPPLWMHLCTYYSNLTVSNLLRQLRRLPVISAIARAARQGRGCGQGVDGLWGDAAVHCGAVWAPRGGARAARAWRRRRHGEERRVDAAVDSSE